MNAAWRTDRYFLSASPADDGSATSVSSTAMPLLTRRLRAGAGVGRHLLDDDARPGRPGHDPPDVGERSDRRTLAGPGHEAGRGLGLGAHRSGRELVAGQFLRRHLG